MSRIRFNASGVVLRPTIDQSGDRVVPASGTGTRLSIWDWRHKGIIGGEGELASVTAIGFLPSGTDLRNRDVISGVTIFPGKLYEVIRVVSAVDDRGRFDHVGAQLREVS